MKKQFGILTRTAAALAAVCAYIILALGLGTLTGYAADKPLELPIYENPVAAGSGGYFVIREDGTLISSAFSFNSPKERMENVAAVYTHEEGAVLVVDRDGTLWSLGTYPSSGLESLYPESHEGNEPLKLLEGVSMAAVDPYHTVILKRDGTLWVAGRDKYGAPWLAPEQSEPGYGESYFVQVMDHVIWADTTYYGGYAVTDDHELWMWGRTEDSTGPEKLADGVTRVSSSNTAITEEGELLNWYYTEQGFPSDKDFTRTWTQPEAILSGVAASGRGYVIMEDGSVWCGTSGWRDGMTEWEQHFWDKYHPQTPFSYGWCNIKDGGASLQELPIQDAAYAAIGSGAMVVLDKNGTLWGVRDLKTNWDDPFRPFPPVRLMEGCYGAQAPAGDGMEHFTAVREYQPGQFTDVKPGDWFNENVKTAYELGLMQGYGDGRFQPDGTITLAEAMTIAARVRATYRGDPTDLPSDGQWYQPYLDYCRVTGIDMLAYSGPWDYSRPATRAELACLLSNTLPEAEFPTLNEGLTFKDMEEGFQFYRDDILWMARAGIMQGKGEGVFDPDAPVKRSEAAAMLSRCVQPELRIQPQGD